MCGIAGIVNINNTFNDCPEILQKMVNTLSHRGPDEAGYAALSPLSSGINRTSGTALIPHNAKVFLGHRRLSIIDLTGSKQPLCNEDKSVYVVFNGEIYNYPELRNFLREKGHKLREDGDTEVLVHLWEELGEDMLSQLRGMFAFAIYDTKKDLIFIARDRFGQKPVYYLKTQELFAFASELAALKCIKIFPSEDFNYEAVSDYFRYSFISSPNTVYKNVYALPPGHFLVFKENRLKVSQYWKPQVTGETEEVDMEELTEKIREAVKLRLRSDVPLGVFLSGGLDSSIITAFAAEQKDYELRTFTISTGQSWCDESEEAKLTATHLKTLHKTFPVTPNLVEISKKLIRHYGQPFADYSCVPTWYLCKETSREVKVVLAGDGGDELFGGYNSYLHVPLYGICKLLPTVLKLTAWKIIGLSPTSKIGTFLNNFSALYSLPEKGENISPLFHRFWRDYSFSPDFSKLVSEVDSERLEKFVRYYNEASSPDPVNRCMEADQRLYMCDDILVKVDIASMANSLECRAPFLDHKLAEFINKISWRTKLHNRKTKYLLRELAKKYLPEKIALLPKKGFTLPMDEWLRRELKTWIEGLIFDNENLWSPFLKPSSVKTIWKEHQNRHCNHSMRLWIIATFVLWKHEN